MVRGVHHPLADGGQLIEDDAMEEIQYIVVHCSDSPQHRGDDAETIHRWHLGKTPPWSGIGYHFVILEDGLVQRGRPVYWQGAHVRGHNRHSIGICLIGIDQFPVAQMAALREQIDRLRYQFPEATICGHRDLDNSKTCPNFDVGEWYGVNSSAPPDESSQQS